MLNLTLSKTVSGSTLQIDKTETSIGQFKEFSDATGFISIAEKQGGMVYEAGWVAKTGWDWRSPYGVKGDLNEPVVHITFDEAKAYCGWRGKRLPTRLEWIHLAYTEQRLSPPKPFIRGKTYKYPTGSSPKGANCLNECDAESLLKYKKEDNSSVLSRGFGHSHVGVTKQGVNGLSDMGANVWEWAKIEMVVINRLLWVALGGMGQGKCKPIIMPQKQEIWLLFISGSGV